MRIVKQLEENPANEEKFENIFNFNYSNRIRDFRIYRNWNFYVMLIC